MEDALGIVGTTQAGKFAVERMVAESYDGLVYRALHEGFRSPVALRCLRPTHYLGAAESEAYVERFRREAEIAFRLSASIPELVRPLHVGAIALPDGSLVPFIAYEWLEGETLDEMIRQSAARDQPLTLDRLVPLLRPVARALAHAHRFPSPTGDVAYVHGDLGPRSILIARGALEEGVRLVDFGLARARAIAAGRGQLGPGERPFTPSSAAPEQWRPQRFGQLGPWTDVWGLALTLVEALVGSPPVRGDEETMMGIALDDRRRPTPSALGVPVDESVEAVFRRALAVDPARRYPTVVALWRALEEACRLEVRPLDEDLGRTGASVGTAISSIPPPLAVGEEFDLELGAAALRPAGAVDATVMGLGPGKSAPPLASTELPALGSLAPPARPPSLEPIPLSPALAHEATGPMEPPAARGPSEAPLPRWDPVLPAGDEPPAASGVVASPGPPVPMDLSISGPMIRRPTPPPSRPPIGLTPLDDRGPWEKMRLPGALLVAGLGMTMIDVLLVRVFGYVLPVSMKWVALPLALAGVALGVLRFVRDEEP